MKSVKDKRVACVLLEGEGKPITMTVANARDVKLPASPPPMMRNGVAYHVQSSASLNMVSTERGGRFVCLIAEMPVERLMDLAGQLSF